MHAQNGSESANFTHVRRNCFAGRGLYDPYSSYVPHYKEFCICLRPRATGVAPKALYERSWTGPILFSMDCSTVL